MALGDLGLVSDLCFAARAVLDLDNRTLSRLKFFDPLWETRHAQLYRARDCAREGAPHPRKVLGELQAVSGINPANAVQAVQDKLTIIRDPMDCLKPAGRTWD